jgi:hypothetical protein
MGYVMSVVVRVLEQPTTSGVAWETMLLAGPLKAVALLGPVLGWASLLQLHRLHQGCLHPLPALLADLPQFTTKYAVAATNTV